MTATHPHRVVIVGGGFAGVRVASRLAKSGAEITLIDRANHHLFQPLLYQVATGLLSEGQVAPALRSMFRSMGAVRTLMGEIEEIDLERRVVRGHLLEGLELPYDTLVLAAGSEDSYFGHDEWEQWALPMKTLDHAARIRSHILGAFEMAEQVTPGPDRDAWLTYAVVGAGPTGVELAGQLSVLTHRVLRDEYRAFDPASRRIILLDAVDEVLPSFAPSLRRRAHRDLEKLGVDVRVRHKVVGRGRARARRRRSRRPRSASPRTRSSGRRACRRRAWRTFSAPPPGSSSARVAVSRSGRTSRSPVIPRCSSSATWRTSKACLGSRLRRSSRVSTPHG